MVLENVIHMKYEHLIHSGKAKFERLIQNEEGKGDVTPQKLGGSLTNYQPKEIPFDNVYPGTHVV